MLSNIMASINVEPSQLDSRNCRAETLSPTEEEMPPRILFMGRSLGGKSSIHKVVFEKMAPDETIRLAATSLIDKDYVSDVIQFEIWDVPGQNVLDELDSAAVFGSPGAVIFVIDAQGELTDALNLLVRIVERAHGINAQLKFEVFLHKIDGIAEDRRTELLYDATKEQQELFHEYDLGCVPVRFHMTSIYDISVYEGLSRVVEELIPECDTLKHLLSAFATSAGLVKIYLFDICTKLAIATDEFPADPLLFHVCSDLVDVTIDFGTIFCVNTASGGVAYDMKSQAVVRSNDGQVITLHSVNRFLAFVCVIANGYYKFEGVVDHNIKSLAAGVCKLLQSYKWTSLQCDETWSRASDDVSDGCTPELRES